MPISLHHLRTGSDSRWAVRQAGGWGELDGTLADLLALPLDQARAAVEAAARRTHGDMPGDQALPPVDRQEVWAAGVTYLRSRDGRKEESGHAALRSEGSVPMRPDTT